MRKFGVIFVNRFFRGKIMRAINYTIIIIAIIILTGACRKVEDISPVPSIEFVKFAIFDTFDILGNRSKGGRLDFTFEDGDGNVGLKPPVANQPDTSNLFFNLFRKIDGKMVEAPANDPLTPSSYRVPYMVRLGQNKVLKGTISITFLYLFYTKTDTISYDFFLVDRDMNSSNIETTAEIIVSENKVYTK